MPTVLFIHGFRFIIWPNDHEPPHVHVFKGDGEAKVSIGNGRKAPAIVAIYGMKKREAKFIWRSVAEHQEVLSAAWEKIHG